VGTVAQSLPAIDGRFAWFWQFLKEEMAPYRGRTALVARMVTASALAMILCMTFKIPYGAYAALYALTISRESIERTANEVRAFAIGLPLAGAYILVGAMLVLDSPTLRFLWVIASLFLLFWVLSALPSYVAGARFGYLVVITIPVWDGHLPASTRVENTLWAIGAITLGSVITLLLELVFAAFRRTDDVTQAIAERLTAVEELLEHYADSGRLDPAAQSAVARLAFVGTSGARRTVQRSNRDAQYKQHMGALVAMVGRLVDLTANLPDLSGDMDDSEREQIRRVTRRLGEIRVGLSHPASTHLAELSPDAETSAGIPLTGEIEKTVSLISHAFTSFQSAGIYATLPRVTDRPKKLLTAAVLKPEHIKFGLRGCLAASLCYVIYNALDWPGISTSVTTCLLTALTTVGASHQKQFLRFAGAVVGGVIMGFGAQIFILPNLDSIDSFTVLIIIVATTAAWFATASSRLSYFGVQIAVAFYLINLEEFKIQTSLEVARDRVVGVFLGLTMMWLVFDRLWSVPAGVEMRKTFISVLRSLALFAREPLSLDREEAIERHYALRETINTQFDRVRSLADGVLFEFGPTRHQDLAFRDSIRRWQPQLRSLFLTRITLIKYRLHLRGFELPDPVRAAQREFDDQLAGTLDSMADRVEGRPAAAASDLESAFARLEQTVASGSPEESRLSELQTFLALSRNIHNVAASLHREIGSQP
jgi:multidrug resistance protein MdtO